MSGRLLRLACTVATAALAAQTVLAPGYAAAAQEPPEPGGPTATAPAPPDRNTPPAPEAQKAAADGGTGEADGADDDVLGGADEGDGGGGGSREAEDGGERTAAELLTELQRLYREAERVTEAYNATEEQLARRRAETRRLDAGLVRARLSLHDSRGAAGRLARQQYQGSTGISPYLRLLLARDPQHALDQGHLIGQLARERAVAVGRLTSGERRADGLARRARAALDAQLTLTARKKKERDAVRGRLAAVEKLLASLTADQLAALERLEEDGVAQAQQRLVASGALGADDRKPSKEGERAVRYAVRQIGKPYVWGAEGPGSYDCSGLTSQAWGHAGTPIPRTSQEQWARLPHVPLRELRPGDLVVYFPEATHVALYLGGGRVVQAPRTGERVKVSPIASHPVLGAVRPDRRAASPRRSAPPEARGTATAGPPHRPGATAGQDVRRAAQ
ncbi:cell wall-associated NlpC family hydrolase [Streptomyces achromogenes]|uniref:Cell wall-associated NlpC family hydrolase n=1 Tax=Streptomyces achromogenes TaxID=67255 RepID=A0ABU0Q6E3_STRAH|nr:C40 family peptidase [Streptomyces achromogenes]MDQ0686240.1 cell wall-associated NlpC family hydrolase [Streptomyces achromogenes]MDQ0833397.1 cell wall-associated NlpC family hydrolase [Streptomyces achromogenes]